MQERKFPQVYCHFEGKKVIGGKRREYWIQDATEGMFPEIMENLTDRFIGDEPTTKYLKCKEDSISMKEFGELWINMLREMYTIVCMTRDEQDNTKLAGFNILTESKVDEKKEYHVEGETIGVLFRIFDFAEKQRDIFKEFHLSKYMSAMGLYVLPDYRGDGLGARILDARELLCRAVGFPATLTAFSSIISQKCAEKVGFQDFYAETYVNLGNIDPGMKIEGIEEHTKAIRFMYKLYK